MSLGRFSSDHLIEEVLGSSIALGGYAMRRYTMSGIGKLLPASEMHLTGSLASYSVASI